MDIFKLIELAITLGGWCIMIGIYTQKIKQHDIDLKNIKEQHEKDVLALTQRQNSTDTILQSINNTLASLDAKVDLLIKGKINIGD